MLMEKKTAGKRGTGRCFRGDSGPMGGRGDKQDHDGRHLINEKANKVYLR